MHERQKNFIRTLMSSAVSSLIYPSTHPEMAMFTMKNILQPSFFKQDEKKLKFPIIRPIILTNSNGFTVTF